MSLLLPSRAVTATLWKALIAALIAGALMPVAAAQAQNRWREPKAINIAHEGGEDEFPSNTLYAFGEAVHAGADMLELDGGVTKDTR
jgi:glycerophosphoryl diester phosphodiesterase